MNVYCHRGHWLEQVDNSIIEPIELRMIKPSQLAVRQTLSSKSPELASLKTSISEHGLLQPIVIRPLDHGFELVAGHRRFAACRSLRWRFIPCKIRDLSDKQAFEIQLTENIQRKSMDPIEEAEAYQKYVNEFGWGGVGDLGKKIGKSEEYVSHRMNLLKLPDTVKEKLLQNNLSISQALEVTHVDNSNQDELANEIINNKLTVKQIRVLKTKMKSELEPIIKKDNSASKSLHLVKKGNLTLKITLSRIDDLIEDAHKIKNRKQRLESIKFLMNLRLKIHSLIDETIHFKKIVSKNINSQ
jgi:ParB family chromosome partitioning protein